MKLYARDFNLRLDTVADAMDALSLGTPGCIFTEDTLHPDFFDLTNGLAGDIFQKFTNYHFCAAFLLQDFDTYSPRIRELSLDHRNHRCVRLFEEPSQAEAWISSLLQAQQ